MTPILTAAQMRQADNDAIQRHAIPGLVLMENASRASCDLLAELLGGLRGKRLAVLCGKGNNGGDGLALARHAIIRGGDPFCIMMGEADELSTDAAAQYAILRSFAPERLIPWESFNAAEGTYDAIIDAMLGTGSSGPPRAPISDAIAWANRQRSLRFALDISTGINSDTGAAAAEAFQADATATMAALKPGLLLGDGVAASGTIHVVDIGAPPLLYEHSGLELLDAARAAEALPAVHPGRHKYDRGKVLLAAGSRGMTGAAVMAAEAALRAGAGLTVLALPESAAAMMPQHLPPEVMTLLLPSHEGAFSTGAFDDIIGGAGSYAAIGVGPGIARTEGGATAVRALVTRATPPLVLDADGLNAFAGRPELLAERGGNLVITPHHGEMAKLLGIDRAIIGEDPIAHARDAARRMNCVAVLKGAPTVIALPDGRCWINGAGNPGMASGGTGDVLTGTITSLIGQTGSIIDGTLAGVFLHSLAGDLAAARNGTRAMTATDIIAHLPDAYLLLDPR